MTNIPEIRFRGFTDAWEQRKFSNALEFSISNNTLSRAGLNYNEGEIKNIHYGDILVKFDSIVDVNHPNVPFITEGNVEDYKSQLLQNGDIIIADTAEDETTGKTIEITGVSNNKYAVSGLHTIVARPKEIFGQWYLGYYLNSQVYRNQLLPLMQGIKVLSLNKANIAKTIVIFPKDKKEQTAIGNFFRTLDNTITLNQRKLDGLKELKCGYLQQMFPQACESVPRIRFAGFNGEWEVRKLGDVLAEKITNGIMNQPGQNKFNIKHINVVNLYSPSFIHLDELEYINVGMSEIERCNVQVGDIFLTRSSLKVEGIARANILLGEGNFVFDDHIMRLKSTKEFEPFFVKEALNHSSIKKEFMAKSKTGTMTTIGQEDISSSTFSFPCKSEQTAIGDFFLNLDGQISAQQTKLDKLKQLKAAYLQRMFV